MFESNKKNIQPGSKSFRLDCLSKIIHGLPNSLIEKTIDVFLSECVSATKDGSVKTRESAYDVLLQMAKRMEFLRSDSNQLEYLLTKILGTCVTLFKCSKMLGE